MKHTKKLLSVLLALVMLLSFGTQAFAANTWTSVPTDPTGLPAGSWYLDFSEIAKDGTGTVSASQLAYYNSFSWDVDFNTWEIQGTDSTGNLFFQGASARQFLTALRKTGINWLPVAQSTTGLQNGDYYIDLSNAADDYIVYLQQSYAAQGADTSSMDFSAVRADFLNDFSAATFFINPGDPMLELKVHDVAATYHDPATGTDTHTLEDMYLPVQKFESAAFEDIFNILMANIHQYTAPTTPTEPTQPTHPTGDDASEKEPSVLDNIINAVKGFISTIIRFFQTLFK